MAESTAIRSPTLPHVAVALASRNGASYIREQILSILWQDGCRPVVYVRDDGSTDGTLAVVAHLQHQFPDRVKLIEDHHGPSGSAAQNFFLALIALREEPLEYVALSDQDDIWEAGKLSRAIREMQRQEADGYSSNLVAFSTSGEDPKLIRKDRRAVAYDHLFQTASAGCTYVMSRRLFASLANNLATKQDHPDVAHDILIYAVARSHGFKWVLDRAAHILYRQHSQNLVGSRVGLAGLAVRWKLARSGWYRSQTRMLEPYLSGRPDELRVLQAITRSNVSDRLWLAANARKFRRRRREALVFAFLQFV